MCPFHSVLARFSSLFETTQYNWAPLIFVTSFIALYSGTEWITLTCVILAPCCSGLNVEQSKLLSILPTVQYPTVFVSGYWDSPYQTHAQASLGNGATFL
jgi:hypothetical protein